MNSIAFSRKAERLPKLLLAISCLVGSMDVSAEVKTFVIDPSQSSLAIVDGEVAGVAALRQGDDSWTTSYSGTIAADVSGGSISFRGGSIISANNSGQWAPAVGGVAGTAPANYGVQTQVNAFGAPNPTALRNLVFDMAGAPIALVGESFPPDTLEFSFPANSTATADYTWAVPFSRGRGTGQFSGKSINTVGLAAALSVEGNELLLKIPARFSITVPIDDFPFEDFRSATFQIQGQLIARSPNIITLPPISLTARFVAGGFEIHFTPALKAAGSVEAASSLSGVWTSIQDAASGATSVLIETARLPDSPAFFRLTAKP